MISLEGASLFSSLFANQNALAQTAAPEPAEGDRASSDDRGAVASPSQTASAAALEYRRAERTRLQIRTQEGDIVDLKFRVKDSLSARSATVENGETTLAELSVTARSTTRLKISVKGDLNADELAAIQSIVEQAGALANEFFAGGTAEAAALASSLELNPDQLDQVRLRLSLRERLTYTQIGTATGIVPAQTAPGSDSTNVPDTTSVPVTTTATSAPSEVESSAPAATQPGAEVIPADAQEIDEGGEATEPLFVDVLTAFDAIATFLTNLLEALSAVPEPAEASESSSSVAARFDTSFKLRVFQSILISVSEATGEDGDETLAPIVDEALEGLAAQQEPALEALA